MKNTTDRQHCYKTSKQSVPVWWICSNEHFGGCNHWFLRNWNHECVDDDEHVLASPFYHEPTDIHDNRMGPRVVDIVYECEDGITTDELARQYDLPRSYIRVALRRGLCPWQMTRGESGKLLWERRCADSILRSSILSNASCFGRTRVSKMEELNAITQLVQRSFSNVTVQNMLPEKTRVERMFECYLADKRTWLLMHVYITSKHVIFNVSRGRTIPGLRLVQWDKHMPELSCRIRRGDNDAMMEHLMKCSGVINNGEA